MSSVELIDYMGSDISVVNAARVSMNKESKEIGGYLIELNGEKYTIPQINNRDKKLIKYLAKHNHWTPFAHTAITLRIKCPISIRTQLFKHKIGFVENEVSRRYVSDEPEFFIPEFWRKRGDNIKQGSLKDVGWTDEELTEIINVDYESVDWYDGGCIFTMKEVCDTAVASYNAMLEIGVCPEQARLVLPQGMYTNFIWTGNLQSLARVCVQRCDSHAQKEVQDIAWEIYKICEKLYPVSWKVLTEKIKKDLEKLEK